MTELIVKQGEVSLSILDGRIKSQELLDKRDVRLVIEYLKFQLDLLTVYHDGLSMGFKTVLNNLDSEGNYHSKMGYGDFYDDIP